MLPTRSIANNMQFVPVLPLVIQNLGVSRQGKLLLDNVNTTVESAGTTIILGPNGAGKSLLLRIAHGLDLPDHGSLKWNQQSPEPKEPWRAFVFQKPVFLQRSVYANLEYVLRLHKIDKSSRDLLIREALRHTGLAELAARSARTLSGGEQQRLNIARAWILNPKVMLLDEPTAELDPSGVATIEMLIKTIAQQRTKIVMTTHSLDQAKRLASDILFLHQGRLIEHTPADLYFSQPKTGLARDFIAGKLLNNYQ